MAFTVTIRERCNAWAGRPSVASRLDTKQDAETASFEQVRRVRDAENGTDALEDSEALIEEYFGEVLTDFEIREWA